MAMGVVVHKTSRLALPLSSRLGFHSRGFINFLSSSFISPYSHFDIPLHLPSSSSSATSNSFGTLNGTPNPNSPKVDEYGSSLSTFLVNAVGFSQPQLSSVHKQFPKILRPSKLALKRAQDVVHLFKEYGFTDSQIRFMVLRCPKILCCRANENLRPKLELMKSLGFSKSDLGHTLSRGHRILTTKNLDSIIDYYKTVYRGDANLLKAVKRFPALLSCNPRIADKQISFLRQCGMPRDSIFYLVCRAPIVLCRSREATEQHIHYLKSLGVPHDTKSFRGTLAKSLSYSLQKMDEKLKFLGTLGFGEEEVKHIVRKYPQILHLSCEKVKKTTEYLLQNGVPPTAIAKRYTIFSLSLEKRIKLRHDVFKFVSGSSHSKRVPPILSFIVMNEKVFLEKYVDNHPDSQKLFEILSHYNHGPTKLVKEDTV